MAAINNNAAETAEASANQTIYNAIGKQPRITMQHKLPVPGDTNRYAHQIDRFCHINTDGSFTTEGLQATSMPRACHEHATSKTIRS